METTYVRSTPQAIQLVSQALEFIRNHQDKYKLSIADVTLAPGRLMRQGVTLIVKIKDEWYNATDDVPMRVESPEIFQYRFCTQEMLNWWKRKRIYSVPAEWCANWDILIRKVAGYLRTAQNRLRRKLQHIAHIMGRKLEKCERRKQKGRDFCRVESRHMCH